MVVRNADGSECVPREVDLSADRAMKRRVSEVLDPFAEDLTPHTYLFDQLGAEKVEDEQGVSVDPDVWTRAIWSGESPEDLLREGTGAAVEPEATPALGPSTEAEEVTEPVPAPPPVPAPVPEPTPARDSEPEPAPEPQEPTAFLDEPEPWEAAEAEEQAQEAVLAVEAAVAPPTQRPSVDSMSDAEVAACRVAQQAAVLEAFAQGGEEAVAAIATKHWSEFWVGPS
jgi:hypothetical protein